MFFQTPLKKGRTSALHQSPTTRARGPGSAGTAPSAFAQQPLPFLLSLGHWPLLKVPHLAVQRPCRPDSCPDPWLTGQPLHRQVQWNREQRQGLEQEDTSSPAPQKGLFLLLLCTVTWGGRGALAFLRRGLGVQCSQCCLQNRAGLGGRAWPPSQAPQLSGEENSREGGLPLAKAEEGARPLWQRAFQHRL